MLLREGRWWALRLPECGWRCLVCVKCCGGREAADRDCGRGDPYRGSEWRPWVKRVLCGVVDRRGVFGTRTHQLEFSPLFPLLSPLPSPLSPLPSPLSPLPSLLSPLSSLLSPLSSLLSPLSSLPLSPLSSLLSPVLGFVKMGG